MKKQNTVSTFRVQDFSFDILKKKNEDISFGYLSHLIDQNI